MKTLNEENKLFKAFNRAIVRPIFAAGLLLCAGNGLAQSSASDSIVQVTAKAQGLALAPSDQLPPVGTFWLISPGAPSGCLAAPVPTPPLGFLPTFQVADGQFVVDWTAGQVSPSGQALAAQASAVVNLVNEIHGAQVARSMGTAMGSQGIPGFGGGGGGGYGDDLTYPSTDKGSRLEPGRSYFIYEQSVSSNID